MKKWWFLGSLAGILLLLFAGIRLSQDQFQPPTEKTPVFPEQTTTQQTLSLRLPSATFTHTLTPSPTASQSPTLTATPTLATQVLEMTLILPEVTLPPTSTPLPTNIVILSEAPEPLEPLPNATYLPYPYAEFANWVSFESDHPAVQYLAGEWTPLPSPHASQGRYHFSEDPHARIQLDFKGAGVRVRYVAFTNGGKWEVVIDGVVVDRIDAYARVGKFLATPVYTVPQGEHVLELRTIEPANFASQGNMLALDALQIYQPDDLTQLFPHGEFPTRTPTPTLIPARQIERVAAPPSPVPTATEVPPQLIQVAVVVGYDENANLTLDASEGVRGLAVRMVEMGTNRVLAHTFTDAQGFAQLQLLTTQPVQVVVPYFGEAWTVTPHRSDQQFFSLLLSPGNQPGLIP